MQLCQSMTIIERVRPRPVEEIDLDGLSSTSDELLLPDGTVPDSRHQEAKSPFASPNGQASQELTIGTDRQVPQSFDEHAIQVN